MTIFHTKNIHLQYRKNNKMTNKICPYLGLKNDQKTVMQYPSVGNCCYHATPTAPVKISHQAEYCLNENHIECPVFKTDGTLPMPVEIIGVPPKKEVNKKLVFGLSSILIMLVIITLILSVNRPADQAVGSKTRQTTTDGAFQATPNDQAVGSTSIPGSIPLEDTNVLDQNWIRCTPPVNWMVYVVKPTDSLVRLALIFNISVANLQAANCMGDRTLVKPGEKIYVPGATPTPTASLTATSTPTRTYQAPVIPFWTNTSPPSNPPPSRPKPSNTPLPPPPPTATEPPPPTPLPPTEPPTPTAPPI